MKKVISFNTYINLPIGGRMPVAERSKAGPVITFSSPLWEAHLASNWFIGFSNIFVWFKDLGIEFVMYDASWLLDASEKPTATGKIELLKLKKK